ncbi:MAG TPA: TIGR04222 domain-containing membrane protein [Bryobacteraceae bacterium]|jgi:uncharacterized protein (TIGR04222 family)|nr:TIGR04222 domain-containing membrane protein [Bryobacteraceae bacterium]
MSPFDLPGPMFLVFYLFCGGLALIGVTLLQNFNEPRENLKVNLSDPYLIAFLRGGRSEAIRVATVSLIDRALLKASGSTVVAINVNTTQVVRAQIEIQLLFLCRTAQEAGTLHANAGFDDSFREYEAELVRLGLMPDASAKTLRAQVFVLFLAVMWGLGIIKILVALGRGRRNIELLVILMLAFGYAGYKITHPPQTGRGKALLADLSSLFRSLKDRAASFLPGSNPTELALLTAVFGIAALPVDVFPHARSLYPAPSSSSGDSGSSCGSSCGGGCGGGCGGCGS